MGDSQQIDQEAATARHISLPELLKLAHRFVWDAEHEHRKQSLELAKILAGDDDAVKRIRARELLGEPEIVLEWGELRRAIAERFPVPLPDDLHEPDPFDTRLHDYAAAVGRGDVQGDAFSAGIAQLDAQDFADEYLRAHPVLAKLLSLSPQTPQKPSKEPENIDCATAATIWERSASWWRSQVGPGKSISVRGMRGKRTKLFAYTDAERHAKNKGIPRCAKNKGIPAAR